MINELVAGNPFLYIVNKHQCNLFTMCSFFNNLFTVTSNTVADPGGEGTTKDGRVDFMFLTSPLPGCWIRYCNNNIMYIKNRISHRNFHSKLPVTVFQIHSIESAEFQETSNGRCIFFLKDLSCFFALAVLFLQKAGLECC